MTNPKKKNNIALEDLARMVNRGFEEMKSEMGIGFNEISERLDRIERILFWDYKNRIEKLEDYVKELQSDFRQLVGFRK
jgi:tetrahydromethanopterin S-methyltransferase subunit G